MTDNSAQSPSELSALCSGCGLCCDGTLFECVELETGEQRLFAAAALLRQADKVVLALPCPEHRGHCCAVYAQRPITCSLYTCKLYDGVASGTTTSVEAHTRVEHIKSLCRLIESLLDWSPHSFSTARFKQWVVEFPGGESEARRLHAQVFLKYGLLRVSLRRHFLADASTST